MSPRRLRSYSFVMDIFPVVHINDIAIAVDQATLAIAAGADGVYLIHHGGDASFVFKVFELVTAANPGVFVGVNLLGYSTLGALSEIVDGLASGNLTCAPGGLWSDDIRSDMDPFSAMNFKRSVEVLLPVWILGGVAFKYTQTFTEDPRAARLETLALNDAVDVITTSGAGTGRPPSVDKIRAMKEAADRPLAVASGLSVHNIDQFKGLVDQVLVASSVETRPYSGVFDGRVLSAMIRKAHNA